MVSHLLVGGRHTVFLYFHYSSHNAEMKTTKPIFAWEEKRLIKGPEMPVYNKKHEFEQRESK